MELILDVQGFRHSNDEFVLKELGAITVQTYENGEQGLTRILFKPPCDWNTSPVRCRATNAWLIRNYHGIPWDAGKTPYHDVWEVMTKVVESASYIYVKGLEKKKWVEKFTDNSKSVINLEDLGCPNFQTMRQIKVYHWHEDNHGDVPMYHCAFENVQRLKIWYLENCTGSLQKSLNLYFQIGRLERMRAEDIAFLTKEFILTYASNTIDEVWAKLPEAMKKHKDIASCLRCRIHYSSPYDDEFDGPPPMIKDCFRCKMDQ